MQKNNESEQLGRTSQTGNASAPDVDANQGRSPMVDLHGRLVIRLANQNGFIDPIIGGSNGITFTSGAAYEPIGGTLLGGPPNYAVLNRLTGYNDALVPEYLQIWNGGLLGALRYTILLPAGPSALIPDIFIYSIIDQVLFQDGLLVTTSTTQFIYTAPLASSLWIAVNYDAIPL